MKKSLLSLFILCIFQTRTYSQTLTGPLCNPLDGEAFSISTGSYTSPGSSGAGQLWDFSNIALGTVDNFTMMTPPSPTVSSVPFTGTYSLATILAKDSYDDITYYKTTANSLELLGTYYVGTYYGTKYSNPQLLLSYPFSLGSTTTNTYNFSIYYATSTDLVAGSATLTADATGTLITPAGTYNDVVRVKVSSRELRNNVNLSVNENYLWYKPGIHRELFSVSSKSTNVNNPPPYATQQNSVYLMNAGSIMGVEQQSAFAKSFNLFPIPATEKLTFESDVILSGNIQLTNNLGQQILEASIVNGRVSIDLSFVPPGIYFAQLNEDGRMLGGRKIIVEK